MTNIYNIAIFIYMQDGVNKQNISSGLRIAKPHIIVMTGMPGCGKSYFASRFSETFNAPLITSTKVGVITGDTDAAKKILLIHLLELLKTHTTIVLDCLAQSKIERNKLAQLAQSHGYEALLVWVQTDSLTARQRFNKSQSLASDSNEFDRVNRQFQPPSSSESPIVISGRHTYPTQSRIVLKKIAQFQTNDERVRTPLPPHRPESSPHSDRSGHRRSSSHSTER